MNSTHTPIQILAENNNLYSIIGIYQSEKIKLSVQQLKQGIINHPSLKYLNHHPSHNWEKTAKQFNNILNIISQEKGMAYIFTNDEVYYEKLGIIYQDIVLQKIIGKGHLKIEFTPNQKNNGLNIILSVHFDSEP